MGAVDAGDGAAFSCRSCGQPVRASVVDLGLQPLANAFLTQEQLELPEREYPLHAYVCESCWLVQLAESATPEELFTDYLYFSSYSDTWLEHARAYADTMVERLRLGPQSLVVEVASNDGYLLRNFLDRDIPVLGIDPARNVAEHARSLGVPTHVGFLGIDTARQLRSQGTSGDLVIANNVLAHVPDLDDFIAGLSLILAPEGTVTVEFPHVLRLLAECQFDTIYHEHYSYLSLTAVQTAFARHGLVVREVEELATHGGSLRVHAGHAPAVASVHDSVAALLEKERRAGLMDVEVYARLGESAARVRRDLVAFLDEARREGRRTVAYGAPAKGNTLLNYCGITQDLLAYTVDRSPHKQGRFLPGSRLPVHAPDRLLEDQPDYVLILPWNIKEEIIDKMSAVQEWGGRFVVPIPRVQMI